MSILRIILLSITLVFAPLLNYSMASSLTSIDSSAHVHSEGSPSNHQHNSSKNHNVKHCSLEHAKGVCNHQANDHCSTSCCVNILLMSSSAQVLTISTIHQSYYSTFLQHAEIRSIDNQLRPPQFS